MGFSIHNSNWIAIIHYILTHARARMHAYPHTFNSQTMITLILLLLQLLFTFNILPNIYDPF